MKKETPMSGPTGSTVRPLRFLLTGIGFQLVIYLTGILIGLFLTPWLLGVLGEREYAIFVFAGLFTNWCGLVDFGMTTASSRFVTFYFSRSETENVNEIANTSILLFSGLGGIVLLVSLIAAWIAHCRVGVLPDADTFAAVFLLAGGAFAVSKLSDAFLGVINGSLRQDLSGAVSLLFRILTGGVTFLIAYLGGRVVAIVAGSLGLAVLNVLLLARVAYMAFPPFRFSPRLFRKNRVRELFGYSVFTFINQLGDLLIQRSDLILIGLFLTLNEVTVYNLVVVTFASYYVSLTQAITQWETNWFTHLYQRGETALFERSRFLSYKLAIYFTVFLSLMLIFYAGAFITRWIGATYLDAFGALVIVATGLGLYRGPAEVNIRVLQGIARHQRLAWLVILQGVLSVILSMILLKRGFGTTGVAIGTVVPALLIHGLVIPLDVCHILKSPPSRYFARWILQTFTAIVAFLPSLILIRWALAPDYLSLLWVGGSATILYFLLIGWVGLSSEERRFLFQFLPRPRLFSTSRPLKR